MVAAVHKGKKIIATKVFQRGDYLSEDDLINNLLGFGYHHQIAQARLFNELLPPKNATCANCGELLTPLDILEHYGRNRKTLKIIQIL
jgi:hypothetical protein